jgi:hypothetical protein
MPRAPSRDLRTVLSYSYCPLSGGILYGWVYSKNEIVGCYIIYKNNPGYKFEAGPYLDVTFASSHESHRRGIRRLLNYSKMMRIRVRLSIQ